MPLFVHDKVSGYIAPDTTAARRYVRRNKCIPLVAFEPCGVLGVKLVHREPVYLLFQSCMNA